MNRLASFLLIVGLSLAVRAQVGDLPRSVPEAEGVPSKAITTLFDSLMALPQTEIHSVIVLRHGKVIGEMYPAPFAPEYRHTQYSCSKTFVGLAVGLAVADNRLRLTDRVAAVFPEFLPDSVSDNLADMTVRHLLTMTSGITPDWNMRSVCSDWIRTYLAKPVKKPGKQFEYDSICTYLLSAIVQKVTGMTVLDYLKQKLFLPMHITEVAWEESPEGFNTGGWGLYIQSESLAKVGLLILNKGVWEGRQLVPASWVEQMMSKQVTVPGVEYGYQMWHCEYPGAVRADGAFGQYVLIVPDKDMVVVFNECTVIDGRNQRGWVWNHLLPAVSDTVLSSDKDYRRLQKKQENYALPLPEGKSASATARQYAGKTLVLDSNKFGWNAFHLEFLPREVKLSVYADNGQNYDLCFGYQRWLKNAIETYPPYSITSVDRFKGIKGPFWVAGGYAWPSSSVLQLKAHYVNWMSALDFKFQMDGEDVIVTVKENFSSEEVLIKARLEPVGQ